MISIKKQSYKEYIIYLFLFLIGFNFAGNAIVATYLLALFVFTFISTSLMVPRPFFTVIILCIGIIFSQLINGDGGSIFSLLKLGVYPLVFLVFYKIADYEGKINEEANYCLIVFFYMMFFFALGNMAHMIANISITDLSNINMGRRILNDIWSRSTTPATIIVGWGCINVAILLYSFEQKRKKKLLFITSLAMTVIYMIFSFMVATRLGIVNALVIVGMFIFMLIRDRKITITFNKLLKFFGMIIIVIILGITLSPYIMSSNLYLRLRGDSIGLLDSNGRISVTIYLLQHFSEALFGGGYFEKQYGLQQHNILFQMYDLYGLLPFACLGGIITSTIKYTTRIVNSHCIRNSEKRFVVLFYFSIILYCFEEPAISSNYIITSMMFGYLGYISALRRFIYKEEVSNE